MGAGAVSAAEERQAVLLLYHGIGEPRGGPEGCFTVSAAAFAQQLELLRDLQARGAITVMELGAWWRGERAAGRPVVLCFDDGWRSDVERVLPALQAQGLRATFFLSTAEIGKAGHVDWAGVRRLARAGMGMAAHGHEHRALPLLPPCELENQLRRARHMLQEGAGTAVQFMAAPYGLWNQRVLETALQSGYSALCTSHPGLAEPGAARLGRNGIRRGSSARQLQRKLCGGVGGYAWDIGRDFLLWTPKHILLRCPALLRRIAPPVAGTDSMSTY